MNKKQRILIITFCIPWPVADGGKMYVHTSVNYLRHYYDITLVMSVYNQADLDNVAKLKAMWPDVKIELVSYIKKLGTKERWKKKIRDFYYDNFSKRAAAAESHVFFNLRKKINNIFLLSPNFLQKCEQLFANNVFDIVQVEYSTNIASINFIPKGPLKLYVEIESLYSIMEDFMAVSSDVSFTNRYLVTAAKNIELDFMRRYDGIFALNESDRQRLTRLVPGQKVLVSPYAVMDAHFSQPEKLANWKPEKMIFIGSENHYPNKDAVEWFVNDILPLVENNRLTLYITGAWSDGFKAKMRGVKNLIFSGFIDDLSELMTDSIMIVPIRLGGGGIRAKVIQAMAFGIPIISTPLGCSGIAPADDQTILTRNDARGFAEAVMLLSKEREVGASLIQAAYKTARENYAEDVAGTVRHRFYQQLLRESEMDNE
ncbi:MAG: glycosyltransferase [Bacteroidota bacterium]